MRRRPRLRLLVASLPAFVALASGCGGSSAVAARPTTPPALTLGDNDARNVVVLTDLDRTRDVARGDLRVYVATDRGLLSFPASGDGAPVRFTTAQGLPSDDVRAVAVDPGGAAIAATADGMVRITGAGVTPLGANPPVGNVRALLVAPDRTGWACGDRGVARTGQGGWQRVDAAVACTGLWPDGEAVWMGTTAGLWRIEEGGVVREHAVTQGIPEGYVRDLLPLGDGALLALLQGPGSSRLGYFDGNRWFGYTIEGLGDAPAVGLAPHEAGSLVVTPGAAYLVTRARTAATVPLAALSVSQGGGVRAFRGRFLTGEELAERPPAEVPGGELRAASRLVEVPENAPTVEAPPFFVAPVEVEVPRRLEWVRRSGGATYYAVTNAGLVERAEESATRDLRSRDLVVERDLQIAVDSGGSTIVLAEDAQLARWTGRRFERVAPPEGATPQAISSGPEGAYLLARRGAETPATFTLYRRTTDGWTVVFERTVDVPQTVVGAPFMTVGEGGEVWAGLRISEQGRERIRGAMRLDPESERVTYFHRGATPEADGEEARPMPDEIEAVETTGRDGFTWFASLSGAVRVGEGQAVVFGEARGVRGEVVTDVLLGLNDRVWVAAAEGLGFTESQGSSFDFPVVGEARRARPARIALDGAGDVWGAGGRGVLTGDGATWRVLDTDDGLPTGEFVDVEVDARERVWLLGEAQVVLLTRESDGNSEL